MGGGSTWVSTEMWRRPKRAYVGRERRPRDRLAPGAPAGPVGSGGGPGGTLPRAGGAACAGGGAGRGRAIGGRRGRRWPASGRWGGGANQVDGQPVARAEAKERGAELERQAAQGGRRPGRPRPHPAPPPLSTSTSSPKSRPAAAPRTVPLQGEPHTKSAAYATVLH